MVIVLVFFVFSGLSCASTAKSKPAAKGTAANTPANATLVTTAGTDEATAALNRGDDYFQVGEYSSAISEYTFALRTLPNNTSALNNRGLSYIFSGNYEKAVIDYTAAIDLEPDNPVFLNRRGSAFCLMGEADKAIDDFTSELRIDPDNKNTEALVAGIEKTKLNLQKEKSELEQMIQP